MTDRTGYVVIFDEEQRADLLHERGDYDGRFADALSAPDWGLKEWEVCFLSFGGASIDYACLAQRGKRVATAKYRVDFSNLVDLKGVPFNKLAKMFPAKLQAHFTRSSTGRGRKVPTETWKCLVNAVKELRPEKSEGVDRLFRLRDASLEKFTGDAADTIALEKDGKHPINPPVQELQNISGSIFSNNEKGTNNEKTIYPRRKSPTLEPMEKQRPQPKSIL